ncbi:uncharacterized protein IL334_005587 [Kwoniella shivajii]|uniref:J domain-containing protein n=1 Tax=Kwoniella shivajii TaxID=564305 RepID=A0ABZ1D535_9TREE|nr:hypothetical protein IL334_005587 [Kwoniella shivajii]
MDDSDPIHNFFPESIDSSSPQTILYKALNLTPSATPEEIRKSYRRLALQYHPDKHSKKTKDEKEELSLRFQKVGFAYAVLSDENRKKRYDNSGRTDENFNGVEEMGWEAYFESLYKRVDRKLLDEDKERYQGSEEEKNDIISAYKSTKGSLPDILSYIPHSTYNDEDRFINLINDLISSSSKEIGSTVKWEKTSTDLKAKEKRRKSGEKSAREAEKAAKELGVWDEFYGSGEKGNRQSNSTSQSNEKSGKGKGGDGDGNGDGLAALILKRQRDRQSDFQALEDKYTKIEDERKSKKGKKGTKVQEESIPEISDADFEALQAKMFPKKDEGKSKSKKTKSK